MSSKDWLIGVLIREGYIKTEAGEILLSKLAQVASEAPESALLEIDAEHLGKTALVRGVLAGGVLYSAQVMEVLPRLTGALIQSLVEKEIVSFAEIQDSLSGLEEEKPEEEPSKKLCALVIGQKKSSPGARKANADLREFDFDENLAISIEKKVQGARIQRIYRRTYSELPSDINALGPDFIVSLHCNAFNKRVSGTEVLYYHKSQTGKRMAEALLNHLVKHLGLPNRGVKPKTSEDRGGTLLRYTDAPCVITEPFFIDNDRDLARAQEDMEGLVAAYATAIDEISRGVV
jgi:N-acetylmuramoyl-L-alanine amidase